MAAPTQYFVDPAINANGGAGTDADPWTRIGGIQAVQNGLDQIVAGPGRDAGDGDQINVISDEAPGVTTTTDDTTTVALALGPYGAPTGGAPLIIRGCSRVPDPVTGLLTGLPVANNRGIGGMDGNNGGWSIYDGNVGATDYVHFIDMHLHNTAGANIVRTRSFSSVIGCELDTSTNDALNVGTRALVANNYIHDAASDILYVVSESLIYGNYIDATGNEGIWLGGSRNIVERNVIITNAVGMEGIVVSGATQFIIGNSIFSNVVSTTAGLEFDANNHIDSVVMNNLIEGFSGAGGSGIDFGAQIQHIRIFANNSFHHNNVDILVAGDCDKNYDEDNDLLMAASPFLKEGAMTFANRFNYFKPAIPVRGRAFPNGCRFDRGAVQVRLATEREVAAVTLTSIPARTELDPL